MPTLMFKDKHRTAWRVLFNEGMRETWEVRSGKGTLWSSINKIEVPREVLRAYVNALHPIDHDKRQSEQ